MKRGNIHIKTSIILLLTLVTCGCGLLILITSPSFWLTTNQRLWELSKPSAYYMKVIESRPDGGHWEWAVYVQGGRPITVTLLNADTKGYSNLATWFDPDRMTVEQIFAAAHEFCARRQRAIVDCFIEYDPQLHYPGLVDSNELIIIRIEEFFPCEHSAANCSSPEPERPP